MVCFWIQHGTMGTYLNVDLDWKTGVAAKDWAGVAKKEKLDVRTHPTLLSLLCCMMIARLATDEYGNLSQRVNYDFDCRIHV